MVKLTYALMGLFMALGVLVVLNAVMLAAFILHPFTKGAWVLLLFTVALFAIGSMVLGMIEDEAHVWRPA
jgi:hypothetical protein